MSDVNNDDEVNKNIPMLSRTDRSEPPMLGDKKYNYLPKTYSHRLDQLKQRQDTPFTPEEKKEIYDGYLNTLKIVDRKSDKYDRPYFYINNAQDLNLVSNALKEFQLIPEGHFLSSVSVLFEENTGISYSINHLGPDQNPYLPNSIGLSLLYRNDVNDVEIYTSSTPSHWNEFHSLYITTAIDEAAKNIAKSEVVAARLKDLAKLVDGFGEEINNSTNKGLKVDATENLEKILHGRRILEQTDRLNYITVTYEEEDHAKIIEIGVCYWNPETNLNYVIPIAIEDKDKSYLTRISLTPIPIDANEIYYATNQNNNIRRHNIDSETENSEYRVNVMYKLRALQDGSAYPALLREVLTAAEKQYVQ